MKTIPVEVNSELLRGVVQIQHLYILSTKSETYRWTDCNNSIFYNGSWYVQKGIEFDKVNLTMTSQVDSIKIIVSNVDKAWSTLALASDIKGSEFTVMRVLLDRSLAIIGSPSTIFMGYVDTMEIDRKEARIEVYSHMIKWQMMTPKRMHSQTCPWIFKGTECNFSNDGAVPIRVPTSDVASGWTKSTGSNGWALVDDYDTDLTIGGTYTADSEYGAGYEASKAFDDNTGTDWYSLTTFPHWIKCQFPSTKRIKKYSLYPVASYYPKEFKLQGSNDDSTWYDLDYRIGEVWPSASKRTYEVRSPDSFVYYRIYIISGGLGGAIRLYEVELIGSIDQVNDDDYVYTTSTSAIRDVYGFSVLSLPTDAVVSSVKVRTRAKQTSASARNLQGSIRVSGTDYDATAISPATAFTDYDFSWTKNPRDNNDWVWQNFKTPDLCSGGGSMASTALSATYSADKAFDDNVLSYWEHNGTSLPQWLMYILPSQKTVIRYTMMCTATTSYTPKDWKLQGMNNPSTAMTGAVADDGGTQTDETTASNNATTNDMTLLPATPAANDAYYFGSSSKFDALQILIYQSSASNSWTGTWEYWNGSVWTTLLGVADTSNGFMCAAGYAWVFFSQQTNWATTTVKSISAYWIRYRVTAFTSVTTQPKGTQSWTGTFTDIDTRSGYTSWSANEKKVFSATNATAYYYYRIWVTAQNSTYIALSEVEFSEYDSIDAFGFYTPANVGGNRVDVSVCFMKATYNVSACDFSHERCIDLNNIENFGGFYYIPELAVKEFWWGTKQRSWTGPY